MPAGEWRLSEIGRDMRRCRMAVRCEEVRHDPPTQISNGLGWGGVGARGMPRRSRGMPEVRLRIEEGRQYIEPDCG